jgi:hypothetical protein
MWRGVERKASAHQVAKTPSPVGGGVVDLIHDSTSYQIILEKIQPVRICIIVSVAWSQKGQLAG